MTDVGLSPPEEARVQQGADETYRVLTGNEVPPPRRGVRVSQLLRDVTREAPLHALAVAFLLGVLVARRR